MFLVPQALFDLLPDGLFAVLFKFIKLQLSLFELFGSFLKLCQLPLQLHSLKVENTLEVICNCLLKFLMKSFVFLVAIM